MGKNINMATVGKIILLIVTIAWGSSFVVLKDTLTAFGNGNFTFLVLAMRFIISGLALVAIFWKKFITINKKTFLNGLILGVILFLAYGIQTIGLNYTTPSKNAFLTSVYCILVPFLSWLILKKKPRVSNVVAGIMTIVGIALVALVRKDEHGSQELLGDGLTILSGLFYALQIIFIAKNAKEDDATQLLIVEILTVAVLCLSLSAVIEFPHHYKELSFSGEIVWKILYLALVCTLFAQGGQMFAQKHVQPTAIALIFSLEAVFGVIFELILGDAKLNSYMIIGFAIIFLAQIISEVGFTQIISLINKRKSTKLNEEEQSKNNS